MKASGWDTEIARIRRDDPGETAGALANRAGYSREQMRRILEDGVAEGRYIKGTAIRNGKRVNVYRIAKEGGK